MNTRAQSRSASSRPASPEPPARRRARAATSGRRRRRLLVLGIALALLAAAAWGVSVSPLVDVDHVQVRGVQHLTAAEVESAAGVHPGDAMVWVDSSTAIAGIEALPYVRDVDLSREWPDTVRITVRERRPSAWVEGPAGTALVDGTGRVLEAVDAPPVGTPQLVGVRVVPPPGGRIDPVDAARVAGALTGLAAVGTASVESTDHGVVLRLASGQEIRMGEATQIRVKLRAALAVLAASDGVPVTYVDVSVPTNPVAG